MPFPWKKVKSNRISQLVNDHLQHSQKRRDGSSLVVETGFPTSLIDLFMKNREKLKKPYKKKRERPQSEPPIADKDQVIVGSPLPSFPSPIIVASTLPFEKINENVVMKSNDVVGNDRKQCDDDDGNDDDKRVLLVVSKMLLVLALAIGTKRFTIGMMLSAFLLYFLEYAGKYASGLWNPSLRFWSVLRFEEGNLEHEVKKEDSLKSGCSIPEIQVVEPKDCVMAPVEEVRSEKDFSTDCSDFEGRLGCQEIEMEEVVMRKEDSVCGVEELKRRKSHRAKIKLRMKKLVPKKLQNPRKEEQHPIKLKAVSRYCVVDFQEQEVGNCVDEVKSESGMSGGDKVEDATSDVVSFDGSLDANLKAATNKEDEVKENESGLIWRYLALCLMILIGLVGGRAFAFSLALSWLLLLKLGERLPRDRKVSGIRSFEKSC